MKHIYNDTFFDYIDASASASASAFVEYLYPLLRPGSVLDLGSGRGVWLAHWKAAGASRILGVDGDYVDRETLAIPKASFHAADLTSPVVPGQRFDLAQSLEVGEHLPLSASETLIDSLTAASDIVLFSAAVPGQGGENHINEQPLSFWQALFADRGYHAYDCIRPVMADKRDVAPWYRYNAVLYANAQGRTALPESILNTALPEGVPLREGGDIRWRLRRRIVRALPCTAVTGIAKARAAVLARVVRASAMQTATPG